MVVLVLGLETSNLAVALPAIAVFGFFLVPVIGVGYAFTGMNFLHVNPAASCGIAHMAIAIFTIIQTSACSIFIEKNKWIAIGIIIGCSVIAILCGFFIKEKIDKSSFIGKEN